MNDAYAIFEDDTQWLDDDDDNDNEPESYDLGFDECGFIPGEGCLPIGSENCDWNCPYLDYYYSQLHSNSTPTL